MRQETIILITSFHLAVFFYMTFQLYPEAYDFIAYVLCMLMPMCGDTVIWSRPGGMRIWQRDLDLNNRTGTIIFNANALAISVDYLPAASISAPAAPSLAARSDTCPNHHVTCQPLHNNCCPTSKECCGLGCCRDNAHCVEAERGWCCPRAAVLCGDRCVRGACCAGGTHACPNEGETCCGRAGSGSGSGSGSDRDDDKWSPELRCCKKGEYCHAGSECRKLKGEEGCGRGRGRGVEVRGAFWAAVCALVAAF
ncbi:hypothetical protein F5X68DRAFT_242366 [Plectosphaerella plurivora]|uniref:Granulin n=1 Tax=Plectosphaerella plurivora TaxID=936078 RepID=A0A9P9A8H7_9PEZI|nr:hypothetical protein F5X68DRAFT_242366 [Plectosphaerella plurivora]